LSLARPTVLQIMELIEIGIGDGVTGVVNALAFAVADVRAFPRVTHLLNGVGIRLGTHVVPRHLHGVVHGVLRRRPRVAWAGLMQAGGAANALHPPRSGSGTTRRIRHPPDMAENGDQRTLLRRPTPRLAPQK